MLLCGKVLAWQFNVKTSTFCLDKWWGEFGMKGRVYYIKSASSERLTYSPDKDLVYNVGIASSPTLSQQQSSYSRFARDRTAHLCLELFTSYPCALCLVKMKLNSVKQEAGRGTGSGWVSFFHIYAHSFAIHPWLDAQYYFFLGTGI